eukprot:749853-Hanusia_phi.AAC.1
MIDIDTTGALIRKLLSSPYDPFLSPRRTPSLPLIPFPSSPPLSPPLPSPPLLLHISASPLTRCYRHHHRHHRHHHPLSRARHVARINGPENLRGGGTEPSRRGCLSYVHGHEEKRVGVLRSRGGEE